MATLFQFDCIVSKISSNEVILVETAQPTEWLKMYSKPGRGHFAVGKYNGYRFIQVVKYSIIGDTVQTNDSSSDVGSWSAGALTAQDTDSDSKITCHFN